MLVQALAWMLFTHLQSRFLMPLLITAAPLLALGVVSGAMALGARSTAEGRPAPLRRWLVPAGCAGALLVQSAIIFSRFRAQRDGEPNAWLALGPGAFTGTAPEIIAMTAERPEWLIARALPASARIYLLGNSAPLYIARPVQYTTTWDKSILASAIEAAPDTPAAWRAALRSAGCDWLLLSEREIARLDASGFLDPALTPDTIARLLEGARLEASWPQQGQYLFRLLAPGQQSPP
jgi:hypothetical protein